MYNILKASHNGIGMLILSLLLLVILYLFTMFLLKKPFKGFVKTAALVGMAIVHLQILLGLVLYFISPLGLENFSGESMGHKISRFYIVEHPIGMLLAAVLITIGYRATKNVNYSDKKKYARTLVFYTLSFIIITYLIPWFLWN